jgi:uncharacterized protein (DUF488 family)
MQATRSISVLTVGHSAHTWEHFVTLLTGTDITAVADVRSTPYSRRHPHFNHAALQENLRRERISYIFLGKELGGRPKEEELYSQGVADYEKMARTPAFDEGLARVVESAEHHRVALMCSEHDPLDCHRCLLVGRALAARGLGVRHILGRGEIVTHAEVEDRLLELCDRASDDLFLPRADRLATAYRHRARKVAFVRPAFKQKGDLFSSKD